MSILDRIPYSNVFKHSTSTKSTQTTLGTSPCTTYKIGYVTISQEIAGGLLMPGEFPTSEEVKRKTQKYTRKLFRDWVTLSAIAKRHEMLTMNTWARKSFSQRTKILLPAWPNMATQHRPDIAAFQNNSSTQSSREAYMWSYIIDLEDLPKPEKFLIFVDVRGLNQPERFVHSDLEMAQLSESSRVAMPSFLNRYTMLFLGRNNVRNCGELWPWSEDQGAFENIRNGIGIHPGHGFQA
ncbi:hypothetical protein B0J11DRAFT_521975 [Dendryphion nanum]|uniref:Uncharacterized protein n=1 Tax=Dendryphion nanum TaxID=256645 RepID=A0A9P9E8H1_9PLEO|nr:hypothetical protein B0J11DRAFT_521975 [Dendryphion nanum]